jgi:hypothetical protein
LFYLPSCSTSQVEDFYFEGQETINDIVHELRKIRSRDDFSLHKQRLEESFNLLADIMLRAHVHYKIHSNQQLNFPEKSSASEALRIELNRILHMEGGREFIEKIQEKALIHLENLE